jgi:hypothetical protein
MFHFLALVVKMGHNQCDTLQSTVLGIQHAIPPSIHVIRGRIVIYISFIIQIFKIMKLLPTGINKIIVDYGN